MTQELKHKTWIDIASKAETVGMYGYTQKDADIFNSYPFKFLCEKIDQLEEQLEITRLAIRLLRIPKEDKIIMSQEINANTEDLIKPVKYYAGIGSREAPSEILLAMTEMAKILEQKGYILRSGHAKGSDMAFEAGVQLLKNKEIFSRHVTTCEEARAIAASIHPAWHNCSDYAKGCHGRNIYQVLGRDLKTPVSFVICWTPEGKEIGGTRTAIVLAKKHKIPVYNLALDNPCPIDAFVERIIKC